MILNITKLFKLLIQPIILTNPKQFICDLTINPCDILNLG